MMVDMESRSTSVWTHQIVELKHTQLARARQKQQQQDVRDMASEKHIGTVYNTLFYVILLYFLHILHSLHNH